VSSIAYSVIIVIIIIIRYINLYTEPGIEATACARELLYVYVVYVIIVRTLVIDVLPLSKC